MLKGASMSLITQHLRKTCLFSVWIKPFCNYLVYMFVHTKLIDQEGHSWTTEL